MYISCIKERVKGVLPTYVLLGCQSLFSKKHVTDVCPPSWARGDGSACQNKSNVVHFNHKTFTLCTHARPKTASLGGWFST